MGSKFFSLKEAPPVSKVSTAREPASCLQKVSPFWKMLADIQGPVVQS